MSEYRCSQCGERYSHDEYMALEKTPMDPTEDDPMKGQGYEPVCECGAKFHSDKWQLVDELDVGDGHFRVSTVALLIGHGLNHDDWYETCIFSDHDNEIVRRYKTQEEAEDGHEKIINTLENTEVHFEPTGKRLVLDE